jgi:hypothetical protein
VRLLLRSTHRLMPTEAGRNFYERAKRATGQADWSLPPVDLWAVFPTGRQASAKARALASFVAVQIETAEESLGSRSAVGWRHDVGFQPIADMDVYQTIVTVALAAKSSTEPPNKVRWEARSETMRREVSRPSVAPDDTHNLAQRWSYLSWWRHQ